MKELPKIFKVRVPEPTGIKTYLDKRNHVHIPQVIRDRLGLQGGEVMEILTFNDDIILRKVIYDDVRNNEKRVLK